MERRFYDINMNGRLYDPINGRFFSPDIMVQNPVFTQNYNRFSYCMNNPLKYTDPSGWNHIGEFAPGELPPWAQQQRNYANNTDAWNYVVSTSNYSYEWVNGQYKDGLGNVVDYNTVYNNVISRIPIQGEWSVSSDNSLCALGSIKNTQPFIEFSYSDLIGGVGGFIAYPSGKSWGFAYNPSQKNKFHYYPEIVAKAKRVPKGDWFENVKVGKSSGWGYLTEINKYKLDDKQSEAVLFNRAKGWDNAGTLITYGGAGMGATTTIVFSRASALVSIPAGLLVTGVGLAGNLRASYVEGDHWDMYRKYMNSENRSGLIIIDRATTSVNQCMSISSGTTSVYLPNGILFGTINY